MTGNPRDQLEHLELPRELVLKFVVTFARFENCAKTLLLIEENSNRPVVSWQKVASRIDEVFQRTVQSDKQLRRLVDWLKREPPQKQVLVGGRPSFQARFPSGQNDTEILLVLIARIRNNLFHGSKGFEREDAVRDEDLLTAGLELLHRFVASDEEFQRHFN